MFLMKILIIGNSNHQFIINLAKYLRIHYNNNIVIDTLSLYNITNSETYKYFDTCYSPDYGFLNYIPKLKHPYRKYKIKKLSARINQRYDIINIQSFEAKTEVLYEFIKSHTDNLILSYWGGDINWSSFSFLQKQVRFNMYAKAVTFTINSLQATYNLKFGNQANPKQFIIELGSEPFNDIIIVKKEYTIIEARKHFGFPSDKYLLQIGYSGATFHQHLKILGKLAELDNYEKQKIFLILPLTYCLTKNYKKLILSNLKSTGIEYRCFFDFLTEKDVALLRRAIDLFIILTVNDQFCSTLLEHLYLGNKVVAGNWLPYHIIEDQWGGKITYADDFFDLKEIIKRYIKVPDNIPNSGNLESIVKSKIFWPDNIIKWVRLFEGTVTNYLY